MRSQHRPAHSHSNQDKAAERRRGEGRGVVLSRLRELIVFKDLPAIHLKMMVAIAGASPQIHNNATQGTTAASSLVVVL